MTTQDGPLKLDHNRHSSIDRWAHLKYRLKTGWREPTTGLGIFLTLLFFYLIAVPIFSLLIDSVEVQFSDGRRAGAEVGAWTFYYLNRVLLSPIATKLFWEPLVHTLNVSIGVISISLTIGGLMAWLLSRTDMFGRRWFATALIVPYMLPSWTFALAWLTLFKNREVGGQPGWLEGMGFSPPDWLAYGQVPITVILALHYTPFVILLFGNALKQFDSQLEESARVLGAGPRIVAWQIILPLMLPSLMSAIVLIFAKCLGEFGVSYVLGLPVNYDVLATSLYRSISSRQPGAAAVLAGAPGWLEGMGFSPPDWLAYGQVPITVILALHYTPFVILLFGNALKQFDSQLEESARVLGAGPRIVAWQIILPLMLPSLMSAIVLIFAKCLGEFGVSYVLGLPVNYDVLATSLYRSISSRQPGAAAVLAGAIMLIGIVSLLIDARLVRESRKFVTVGGKGAMNRVSRLGTLRMPATAVAALIFFVSVGLPVVVLLLSTIMRLPGDFSFSNFTLDYWIGSNLEFVGFAQSCLSVSCLC